MATKSDFTEFKRDISVQFADFRAETLESFANFRAEMLESFADFRAEMRTELAKLETRIFLKMLTAMALQTAILGLVVKLK